MCRVPPVGGESEATWRLFGEVVGSGQCVCTGGECLHRSGAGATSRSNLRRSGSAIVAGSRSHYRQISTDPGVSPDRETFQTQSPGNRFQPTQNSTSAFPMQGTSLHWRPHVVQGGAGSVPSLRFWIKAQSRTLLQTAEPIPGRSCPRASWVLGVCRFSQWCLFSLWFQRSSVTAPSSALQQASLCLCNKTV